MSNAKRSAIAKGLLGDDRFKQMFDNPDFEIDKEAEDYRLLSAVLKRADRDKARRKEKIVVTEPNEEDEGKSTDDDLYSEKSESEKEDEEEEEEEEEKDVEMEDAKPAHSKMKNNRPDKSWAREEADHEDDDKEFSLTVEEGANFDIMQPAKKIQSYVHSQPTRALCNHFYNHVYSFFFAVYRLASA